MPTIWESKGEKVHTRQIEVSTYDYDGQRIIVEGFLKDDRFHETHVITGETFPAGVVHHMVIRLLVNCSNLLIEDIDVEMRAAPRGECRETIDCLAAIKGLTITRGFTSKVKKLAGGNRGCTHLVELILAMAPAAVQGFGAHRSWKPSAMTPERAKMLMQHLVDTCWTWRAEGPFVELMKQKLASALSSAAGKEPQDPK